MSLFTLISRYRHDNRIFLTELDGRSITYRAFFDQVHSIAKTLLEQASPSEVLIINSAKSIETVAIAFASISAGIGYCFLDPALPDERRNKIINAVNPALICTVEERTFAIHIQRIGSRESRKEFSGCLVFTSGSTGVPKGVLNSYCSLEAYVDSMLEVMPATPDLRWLSICPAHFDVFQLDFLLQSARGASIVVAPHNLLPQQYLQILNNEKITEFLSISTLLKMFVDAASDRRAPSVQKLYYGGEGCSVSILNDISKIFPNSKFCQFYGPTENCNNTTFFKFDKPFRTKTGYMPLGAALKNVQISIRDDDGNVSATNQTGQIVISGSQILSGYLDINTGQVTRHDTSYYESGDYGYRDIDGVLWFEGRRDDIVKINGNRVSLLEVNSELSNVVGSTSTVASVVINKNGYSVLVSGYASDSDLPEFKVREELANFLPAYALPKRLFAINRSEVKVLSTGKTDFSHFKELLVSKFNN